MRQRRVSHSGSASMFPAGQVAVMVLPAEIDLSNARTVYEQLRTALAPGVTVLVADLSATTFCDAAGVRDLARAQDAAMACGAELRLAVPLGRVRNVLDLIGPACLMPLYENVADAENGTRSFAAGTVTHLHARRTARRHPRSGQGG
jgi:anti-anti-sigma factor